MVAEVLVDRAISDGQNLITALHRGGFDVSAAAWLKAIEPDRWELYIVSESAVGRLGDALGRVYAALDALQPTEANYDNVRLLRPGEPLGKLLQTAAGRFAGHAPRVATPFRSLQLSLLGFDDALIYPPVGQMTPTQVMQAVATLMNRTGLVSPSQFELTGGRMLSAVPVGIDMDFADGSASVVSIKLHNTATGKPELHPVTEIVDIR